MSKMETRAEGNVLVMERIFDAPRELVFKAFTEEEHLNRWFGPRGWSLSFSSLDLRPGGVWHYCMKCEEQGEYYGMESWNKTVFREISAPDRLVYEDYFSDAEGNIAENMPGTKITMEFLEHEGKTKLVSRTLFQSVEELQKVLDMGVVEGTSTHYDCLDDLLATLQAA